MSGCGHPCRFDVGERAGWEGFAILLSRRMDFGGAILAGEGGRVEEATT
jgi:hypothetical protein